MSKTHEKPKVAAFHQTPLKVTYTLASKGPDVVGELAITNFKPTGLSAES